MRTCFLYQKPLVEGTRGCLWSLAAYQSPRWPPGSFSVTSACYTVQSSCWHPGPHRRPLNPTPSSSRASPPQLLSCSSHHPAVLTVSNVLCPFSLWAFSVPSPSPRESVVLQDSPGHTQADGQVKSTFSFSVLDSCRCLRLFSHIYNNNLSLNQYGVVTSSVYT